jgi:hypothetical protein
MSKNRWLAGLFALAFMTQVAFGQVKDEDNVPDEDVPFAPADSIPPPAREASEVDSNWMQGLVEQCVKSVQQAWAQGTCPNCPVVRAITFDPYTHAVRNVRTVVRFVSGVKGETKQCCEGGCPLAAQNKPASAPPCVGVPNCCDEAEGCAGCPQSAHPPICSGFGFAFPNQVNAGCQKATGGKSGCCGNCGCKSCGKSNATAECPFGFQLSPWTQMPQFVPPWGLPGCGMGPILQHAPFAQPGYGWPQQQWAAQQQWMLPPGWGQHAEWNHTPPVTWVELHHPVMWTRGEEANQAVYQVVAKKDAVYINTPTMEARCQRMTCVGTRERVLLEGDVRLICKKGTDVTRIEAPRILVDLVQGTFTVEAGKAPAAVSPPSNVGSYPVPPVGPLGTWGDFWERMCGYGQECDMAPYRNLPPPTPSQVYQRSER